MKRDTLVVQLGRQGRDLNKVADLVAVECVIELLGAVVRLVRPQDLAQFGHFHAEERSCHLGSVKH